MSQKKIFFITVPAVGHTNPILKTVKELVKEYNFKVIVFSIITFKKQIEDAGAELRTFDNTSYDELLNRLNPNYNTVEFIENFLRVSIETADEYSLKLAKLIDEEKPDLILRDNLAFYAKFTMRILKEYYENRDNLKDSLNPNVFKLSSPPPIEIVYRTSLTNDPKIYPNDYEKNIALNISPWEKIFLVFKLFKINRLANELSKKYQVTYHNPYEDLFLRDPNAINIIFTFTELQPRGHLFNRKTHFVGGCVDESIHLNGPFDYEDETVNKIIKEFPVLNDTDERFNKKNKLIYVSIGTVFNENIQVFSIIIDSFNKFIENSLNCEDYQYSNLDFNDMTILFSMGSKIYKHFDNLIKTNKLKIHKNMIFTKSVPQLEILKRASLFITHSGINSTNESVYYGVPMICVPFNYDQPLNAHRIATELGLGIVLYHDKMTDIDVCSAVHKIFADNSFFDRCSIYSNLSRKNIGYKNAAKIISNTLNKC